MAVRVGINGFGRIGRQSLKAIIERAPDVEVVAVNDLVDTEMNALLFKHDSTYGALPGHCRPHRRLAHHRRPRDQGLQGEGSGARSSGATLGVDIVHRVDRPVHGRRQGRGPPRGRRQKVIISAPAKGEDVTIVLGVNEDVYDPDKHHIISNASCTTNCLAPVAKVVNDGSASSAA